MRVGVGLPNVVPGTSRDTLVEWATRIESGPFTSAGVLHRVAYDAHDPLDTLALVAPETRRLGLVTMVAIGPLYETPALATTANEIHAASAGRLTLGLAVGARIEDYRAAGVDPTRRGRLFDEQLDELRDTWTAGDGSPGLVVGGAGDAAFARVARYADGYVHGGGPPRAFARAADRARTAWEDADRPGNPVLWGQSYFALGDDAIERGRAYMLDYYAFTGPFAERIAEGLLTTPQQIAAQIRGYAEAGCDELVLLPAVSDVEQVDRLADVMPG